MTDKCYRCGRPLDWADHIRAEIRKERAERFKDSPQITLGELIKQVESAIKEQANMLVYFDFVNTAPENIACFWNAPSELMLTYHKKPTKAENFLDILKWAVDTDFSWKGGEYYMTEDTPIWVGEEYCRVGMTGIIGTFIEDGTLFIETKHCKY